MTTEKIKLNSNKLGTLFSKANETNVDVPPVIQIVSATNRNKYIDGIATDTILKIAMQAIDIKAVEVAKTAGFELADMPTFTVEIQNEKLVEAFSAQSEKLVGQKLLTENAQIGLRWVSRGQTGSWGGLKLILPEIKPAGNQSNSTVANRG